MTKLPLIIVCALLPLASTLAHAQDGRRTTFEQIEVKTITPDELGGGVSLEEPAALLNPSLEDAAIEFSEDAQQALRKQVSAHVVELAALYMPPKPYEQIPMIYNGHGVWLSAKDDQSSPVLISTLSWLQDAQEIYIVPTKKKKKKKSSRRKELEAQSLKLEQLATGREAWRAFKKRKKDYIKVSPVHKDSLRGLISLESDAKGLPSKGLQLIPKETTSLNFLFGYTHFYPEQLLRAQLLPARSDIEELSFFFLVQHNITLGAPLFNELGQIIMLSALPHPKEQGISLAIPPGALRAFVRKAQGLPEKEKK